MKYLNVKSEWQRSILVLFLIVAALVPLIQTLVVWPELPRHTPLSEGNYKERLDLLKYFISLGFSVLGATWYLTSNASLSSQTRKFFSWGWISLGTSLLSSILQIYLTYKDYIYWPRFLENNFYSLTHKFKYVFGTNLLHLTYKISDYLFFIGAILLIVGLVGILNQNNKAEV